MSQLHMLSIYTVKSKYWWGEYLTTLAGLCLRLQQPQYATFHVQRGHSFAAIHIKFFHLRTVQQDKAGFKIINLYMGSFPRYRNQTRTQQSSKRLSELVSRFKQNFIFEIFRSPSHTWVLGWSYYRHVRVPFRQSTETPTVWLYFSVLCFFSQNESCCPFANDRSRWKFQLLETEISSGIV